jgi:hypothetical protein
MTGARKVWAIRAIFILLIAALTAAPPAMAQVKEYDISDVYGWFTPLIPSTDQDTKILITKDSITIFFVDPSDWTRRRGLFEKLGKNLFVLLPEEMIDSTGADLLSKAPCPIYSIEISKYGWRDDGRLAVSITSYPSMEGLRAGKVCIGSSYIPIVPPFDKPIK